jgi:hypothetical protein
MHRKPNTSPLSPRRRFQALSQTQGLMWDLLVTSQGFEVSRALHVTRDVGALRTRPQPERRGVGEGRPRKRFSRFYAASQKGARMHRHSISPLFAFLAWSSLCAAAGPQPAKTPRADNRPAPDALKRFIGTWTDKDGRILVGIGLAKSKIRIRECSATGTTSGTEFFAKYSHDKITAIGNAQDFYKFQLPSFKLLETGELLHECGDCGPDTLHKTTTPMPKVPYTPPVNND